MNIELNRSLEIQSGTFNVLVSPEELALEALRHVIEPRRFLLLYVCGNYSRLLSRINLRTAEFDIRRAFTASQLLTILEDAHQTFLFLEHDPALFAESAEMADYVAMALRELARESTVLLYSPELDEMLRPIADKADRVFYFEKGDARSGPQGIRPRCRRSVRSDPPTDEQSTLEAF